MQDLINAAKEVPYIGVPIITWYTSPKGDKYLAGYNGKTNYSLSKSRAIHSLYISNDLMHFNKTVEMRMTLCEGIKYAVVMTVTEEVLFKSNLTDIVALIVEGFATQVSEVDTEFTRDEWYNIILSYFRGENKVKTSSEMKGFIPSEVFLDEIVHTPSVAKMSFDLPGMKAQISPPCGCFSNQVSYFIFLRDSIMHLNDFHKEWTREKIADWLDELHDSGKVNLEFSPWDEGEEENEV